MKDLFDRYQAANDSLVKTAGSFTEEQFFKRPEEGKWSAAENMEHLILATKPMIGLFLKPEVIVERWGTTDKPSRSYDEIANAYLKATNGAGKAPERLVPQATEQTQAVQLDKFKQVSADFLNALGSLNETQMLTYQIPHPFIGNLTVKEFMHFMTFHVDHHHKAIKNIL